MLCPGRRGQAGYQHCQPSSVPERTSRDTEIGEDEGLGTQARVSHRQRMSPTPPSLHPWAHCPCAMPEGGNKPAPTSRLRSSHVSHQERPPKSLQLSPGGRVGPTRRL